MDLQKVASEIINADEIIRYLAIVDHDGNVVYRKVKKNKASLESTSNEEKYAFELSLMKNMHDLFDESFGKTTFTHTVRELIHQLVYYTQEYIIYVTCQREAGDHKIMDISAKIENIIKNNV